MPSDEGRGATRRKAVWTLGFAFALLLAVVAAWRFQTSSVPVTRAQLELKPAPVSPTNLPASAPASPTNLVDRRQKEALVAELNTTANNKLQAGDAAGAAQTYQQAIALTPNDEDLHFNLGIAYVRLGELTNAEHEYNEALRLLPDYPEVHNNLGNLLMRQGRIAEAEAHYTEAIKQMPEYAQAHNSLGILRQRQKRTNEALACFQKAVQCESNYWEGHFNLAGAYLLANEPEKGIAELRETLKINPQFAPAQRILAAVLGGSSNAPISQPGAGTN
ncbi:MAG TPA: tetratricopeptide repeat protein [Verrucomicrobiae bacterium]